MPITCLAIRAHTDVLKLLISFNSQKNNNNPKRYQATYSDVKKMNILSSWNQLEFGVFTW